MKIFILIGSHREQAQSTKVGEYIAAILPKMFPKSTHVVCNLENNPIPLWNQWFWDKSSTEYQSFSPTWEPIEQQLTQADAVIIISPERAGMATPAIKNFFLYTNAGHLGNKPGLIVSVSAGRGGRYPIADLRMTGTKNNQLCYIPQHVIVDHVNDVLNDDALEGTEKADIYTKDRLQYSLGVLVEYAKALKGVRESGIVDVEKYGHGM